MFFATAVQSLIVYLDTTEDTNLVTWEELSDFYQKTKIMFGEWFFILQVVMERTNEIGTLMALGSIVTGLVHLLAWPSQPVVVPRDCSGFKIHQLVAGLIIHTEGCSGRGRF